MRNRDNLIRILLIVFSFQIKINILNSQNEVEESFEYEAQKIIWDSGLTWENLSLINSSSSINLDETIYLKPSLGVSVINSNDAFLVFKQGFLSKNFLKFYINSKIFLTHNYRNNYFVFDNTKFGFKNDWVNVLYCRGRENWGAGNNIELALSEDSKYYDYIMLSSNYGNVRVKYIHGLLERKNNDIYRYVNARGAEWTNRKSLIIGFSETIIYSGFKRNMDIAYLNPILTHLEIELNNRSNYNGGLLNANAVWQLHLDWLYKNDFRISLNYLIDEFVIDSDLEKGKRNADAISFKFLKNILDRKNSLSNIYLSSIKVGSSTLRHLNGENNFVNKDNLIGWKGGSDIVEHKIGIDYLRQKRFIFNFSLGLQESGSENIITKKYDPILSYSHSSFPIEPATKIFFVDLEYYLMFLKRYYINFYIFYPFYEKGMNKMLNPKFNFSFNLNIV